MKWTHTQTLLEDRLLISKREGQKTYYGRCVHSKPHKITPLNTRDESEARTKAARFYFQDVLNLDDIFPAQLDFTWNLFQEETRNLKTLATIRRHITNMIMPIMGDDLLLDDLEKPAQQYIQKRQSDGKSVATIDAELASLTRVVRWSRRAGLVKDIITLKVARLCPGHGAVTVPTQNTYLPETKLPSLKSLPSVLEKYASDKNIKPHQRYQRRMMMYASLLALSTGAPPRTIRSLRNWCISFNDQDECRVVIGLDGKTKTAITASFFGDTKRPARWVRQWQKMQKYNQQSDYLFASSTGGNSRNSIPEAFQRFIKKTGYDPISFLNLRHAYLQCNDPTRAQYGEIALGPENDSPRYIINGRKAHSYIAPAYDNPEAPPHIRFNDDSSIAWQSRLKAEHLVQDLRV